MEKIDWTRDRSLLESDLLGVRAVALYVLVNGRNAWWNTTSRRYPGANALAASISEAKAEAEARRTQGTWFTIAEVPGLVLLADGGAVGAVDFHPEQPFVGWNCDTMSALSIGTPLRTVIESLNEAGRWKGRHPNANSFIQGKLGRHSTDQTAYDLLRSVGNGSSFEHWRSMSRGGGYLLGWSSTRGRDYSAAGAIAIRNRFVRVNGKEAVATALAKYWSDSRRGPEPQAVGRFVQAIFGADSCLAEGVDVQAASEQIEAILGTVSQRDALVVAMRLGLGDRQPETLAVVARRMGITRERARQIESKAFSRLRHPSRSQVMRDYLAE